MKLLYTLITIVGLLSTSSFGFDLQSEIKTTSEVTKKLQESTVTVVCEGKYGQNSSGTGVLFTREIEGKKETFIWTAAHVIANLKTSKKINDKTIYFFKDPHIAQEIYQDGKKVGEYKLDAKVIKYSDADDAHDLAVLYIYYNDSNVEGVNFYKNELVPIGTEIYHVGCLLGDLGTNSLTTGIISKNGRRLPDLNVIFDQTTATAFPGSSGGGIFLKDGQYIGMLVRGASETFNFIVPIRRIHEWAKEEEIEWLVDPSKEAPKLKDILKMSPFDKDGLSDDNDDKKDDKKIHVQGHELDYMIIREQKEPVIFYRE